MKDYETPVFSRCKNEHNKLHVVLTLFEMKANNYWSDKYFNEYIILLQFFRDSLPKGSVFPRSTYQLLGGGGSKMIFCNPFARQCYENHVRTMS
jgi:hypothetical protein